MSTSSEKYPSGADKRRMNTYAAKVMGIGVAFKAVIMATVVSFLAAETNTTFAQAVFLVLISATATGIFGLIIVLIQTHAEKGLHQRIDYLETKANVIDSTTQQTKTTTEEVASAVKDAAIKEAAK
jgi:hypothetical protein